MKLTIHAPGLGIDARHQLGPKLVNFGTELRKNRLDCAETLIHLLIGALEMGDPNSQRVTHGMILTQLPAPLEAAAVLLLCITEPVERQDCDEYFE